MFAYVFQAWLPMFVCLLLRTRKRTDGSWWSCSVIFPQVEQPKVLKGNLATIGISAGIVVFALLTLFLQTRDERIAGKRRLLEDDISSEEGVSKSSVNDPIEREDNGVGSSLKRHVL